MTDAPTRPRRRAKDPTTPDPIEIAMGEVGGDPARRLLASQDRLVRWQIARERAGFWLRVLMGLGGLAAAALVGLAMWNASQARGIVIDAIEAPPHLVAQGYTGKALAAQLQDGLLRLDELIQTRERIAEVRESDRGVKIDIPNTGVSIDQVDKFLRGWLGHETVVGGELVDIKDGPEAGALALTLRQTGKPAQRVVSKERDVAALIHAGAERMYGASYPSRYLTHLRDHGRAPEAAALAREYAGWRWYNARAAGLSSIASEPTTPARQALALRWQAATTFGDRSWGGWNQLALTEEQFGHVDHAMLARRRAIYDGRRAQSLSAEGKRSVMVAAPAGLRVALGDLRSVESYVCAAFSVEPCSLEDTVAAVRTRGNLGSVPQAALALARAHDAETAARLLAASSTGAPWVRLRAQAEIALERQDWAGLLDLADRSDALARQVPAADFPNRPAMWRGYALARLGLPAAAEAPPPIDCYDCLIAAAMAAAARRRTAEAERLFTAAERQGPSLHRAQLEHARARLARGDAAGAIALVKPIAAKPGQADALFIWGEALAAQGDGKAAKAKFRAAAKIAPWWAEARAKAAS